MNAFDLNVKAFFVYFVCGRNFEEKKIETKNSSFFPSYFSITNYVDMHRTYTHTLHRFSNSPIICFISEFINLIWSLTEWETQFWINQTPCANSMQIPSALTMRRNNIIRHICIMMKSRRENKWDMWPCTLFLVSLNNQVIDVNIILQHNIFLHSYTIHKQNFNILFCRLPATVCCIKMKWLCILWKMRKALLLLFSFKWYNNNNIAHFNWMRYLSSSQILMGTEHENQTKKGKKLQETFI